MQKKKKRKIYSCSQRIQKINPTNKAWVENKIHTLYATMRLPNSFVELQTEKAQ